MKEPGQKIVVSLPASIQKPTRAVRNLGLNFATASPAGNSNIPEPSPFSSLQTRVEGNGAGPVTFRATDGSIAQPERHETLAMDSEPEPRSMPDKSPGTIKLSEAFMRLDQIKIHITT